MTHPHWSISLDAFFGEEDIREAAFAFARELGSLLARGPAPFLATALVAWASGAWWPVACCIIMLSSITAFAVWCGPETYHNDIASAEIDSTAPDAIAIRT